MECISLCKKDDNCGAFQWTESSPNQCTLISNKVLVCDKGKLDSTEVFVMDTSNSIFTCDSEHITIYFVSRFQILSCKLCKQSCVDNVAFLYLFRRYKI